MVLRPSKLRFANPSEHFKTYSFFLVEKWRNGRDPTGLAFQLATLVLPFLLPCSFFLVEKWRNGRDPTGLAFQLATLVLPFLTTLLFLHLKWRNGRDSNSRPPA